MSEIPLPDPLDEAARLTEVACAAGVVVRVTGGVGVALRCPSAAREPLRRSYADIDVVGRARERRELSGLLAELGYEPDRAFNALNAGTRLFFWDSANGRQLDVFLDRVEMCHRIDLGHRLDVHDRTASLADLLLMKLQIVETNEKDLLDMVALLADHPLSEDEDGINVRYLAEVTGRDWGLWRTVTMIAERAAQFAGELSGFEPSARVCERAQRLLEAFEASPKTRAWRLRARVGDRVRWYELPEEEH